MTAKTFFITGGSSGIGLELARLALAAGHAVAITGRDAKRLQDAAERLGQPDRVLTIAVDATDWPGMRDGVRQARSRFGRIDVVVANAGFIAGGTLASGDPEQWRDMVLTNVYGPAILVRAAIDALTESRGRVVLVGSVAGRTYTPGNLYSVTKHAVAAMAANLRLEVTERGIGVSVVEPGRVETPFWEGKLPDRPMLPADAIARAIMWVCDQPDGVDVNDVLIRPIGQEI